MEPSGRACDYVTYRNAVKEDHPGIIKLSRVALKDGYKTDYIPAWLDKMFDDPNRVMYVAVKGEEVVGFSMLLAVDDGRTLIGEAGRIHPDMQAQGVFDKLKKKSAEEAFVRWPHVFHVRHTSTHTSHFDGKSGTFSLLLKRIAFRIKLPSSRELQQFLTGLTTHNTCTIKKLDAGDLTRIFSDKCLGRFLYPENKITVEHDVFEVLQSNIPIILRYHDQILFSQDASDTSACALSIGGRLECDDQRSWRYNFNYSGIADLDVCYSHIKEHLTKCVSQAPEKENVYLIVMLPEQFKIRYGVSQLMEFFREKLNVNSTSIDVLHQYVMDLPLSKPQASPKSNI